MSPELADRILHGLNLNIFDLMSGPEITGLTFAAASSELLAERLPQPIIEQQPATPRMSRKQMKVAPMQVKRAAS